MTTGDEKFRHLMAQALAGSDEAAQELFQRYEDHLKKTIRVRLHQRMRSKFDSMDIVQDVWASFFAQPPERRVFATPSALMAFLTRLARNKVIAATRQRMVSEKYNVQRECSLDDSQQMEKDQLLGRDATPSQVMSTEEEWTEFLRKQPLVYRRIFILLREGKTSMEIATEIGINERMVRRVVARLTPGVL